MNNTSKLLPDFIIIGAMKCATSTIHDQLALQSGFTMSSPKEPNFFSNDEIFNQGIDWYHSLFDGPAENFKGESSTHYTKRPTYPNTIARMQQYGLDDVKLIYVIRDPIDRLISHYIHDWSERKISSSIDDAIEKHPDLIHYSKYSYQLEAFLEHYPKSNIKILFFERFINNQEEQITSICQFLGYPYTPSITNLTEAKNVSSERIRKFPLYEVLLFSPPMRAIRRALVPQSLRDKIKQALSMKKRPQLSELNKEKLKTIFNEDLKKLSSKIDINLNCDNFKATAKQTKEIRFK